MSLIKKSAKIDAFEQRTCIPHNPKLLIMVLVELISYTGIL